MSWFVLAATGNVAVFGVVLMLSMSPLSVPVEESFAFLFRFVDPLYAPELLIFTSIPGVLGALRANDVSDSERDEAVRLIAWAVRVVLTFVLMFAVVILAVAPENLATVLLAVLLGFVTFVLAERLAPPLPLSVRQRLLKADDDLSIREMRADAALGPDWHRLATRRSVMIIIAFALAPVVVQLVAGVVAASLLWSPAFAFSSDWIRVMLLTTYGSVLLTFTWLLTADRTESSQARRWKGITGAVVSVGASAAFASAFVFAGGRSWVIGVLILAVTGLQALLLWTPADWFGSRLLTSVAATTTSRHLERATRAYAPVFLADEAKAQESGSEEVGSKRARRKSD